MLFLKKKQEESAANLASEIIKKIYYGKISRGERK